MELESRFVRSVHPDPAYQERLRRELEIITRKGFVPYFHKVLDILDLVRDLPHLTRGSAGSSLVCYYLGITDVDPVAFDIPLERFLHDLREDDPDIDIDFEHHRQNEVHDRIFKRWPGRAFRISNVIHYRPKSAIREALRRHGYRSRIPRKPDMATLLPGKEKEVLESAEKLLGEVRGMSLHCGGVIVLDREPDPELLLTPTQIRFDKRETEKLGHLKIDILSNRGLSQLMEIDQRPIEGYPAEDDKTCELLAKGDTIGVTQAESPAFRKMLRALRPRGLNDVILAMGLIRPAAASRGRKGAFFEAWDNDRSVTNLVFEDDLIKKISELTGKSYSESDIIRKWFSKGNAEKTRQFGEWIADRPDNEQILSDLSQFREYSLCKAHGVSYGRLVWALAYQKAHRPMEFWRSTLLHASSMYRPWVHVQEAKKAGWKITAGAGAFATVGDRLVASRGQLPLIPMDGWEEYSRFGYWSSNRFMPGCYYRESPGGFRFKGLIGTYRTIKDGDKRTTFLSLGVGYDRFIDVVYDGYLDCHELNTVEGEGRLKGIYRSNWIQMDRLIATS